MALDTLVSMLRGHNVDRQYHTAVVFAVCLQMSHYSSQQVTTVANSCWNVALCTTRCCDWTVADQWGMDMYKCDLYELLLLKLLKNVQQQLPKLTRCFSLFRWFMPEMSPVFTVILLYEVVFGADNKLNWHRSVNYQQPVYIWWKYLAVGRQVYYLWTFVCLCLFITINCVPRHSGFPLILCSMPPVMTYDTAYIPLTL